MELSRCRLCKTRTPSSGKLLHWRYAKHLKDIRLVLLRVRSPVHVRFVDAISFSTAGECLKKFYGAEELLPKLRMLVDYYKFHTDVPKVFMRPLSSVAHMHHDRCRRLNYLRVMKLLQPPVPPQRASSPAELLPAELKDSVCQKFHCEAAQESSLTLRELLGEFDQTRKPRRESSRPKAPNRKDSLGRRSLAEPTLSRRSVDRPSVNNFNININLRSSARDRRAPTRLALRLTPGQHTLNVSTYLTACDRAAFLQKLRPRPASQARPAQSRVERPRQGSARPSLKQPLATKTASRPPLPRPPCRIAKSHTLQSSVSRRSADLRQLTPQLQLHTFDINRFFQRKPAGPPGHRRGATRLADDLTLPRR